MARMRAPLALFAIIVLLFAAGCGDDDSPAVIAEREFDPGGVAAQVEAYCGLVMYNEASEQLGQDGDAGDAEKDRQGVREDIDRLITLVREDPEATFEDDEKDRTVKEFAVDQVNELETDGCDEELARRLQRAVDAA